MYIIKNAFANINRNKGRNILFGLIIFLILFSSAVSIAIYKSSGNMIESYKSQFSSAIILTRNDEKLPNNLGDYREPGFADYEKYAQSDLLKSTTFMAVTTATLSDGKAVDETNGMMGNVVRDEGADESVTYKPSTNMLHGVNENAADTVFEGTRKLVEGKMFSNQDEVVISKELAALNEWHIGDKFRISTTNLETFQTTEITLTITGIYEDSAEAYQNQDEAGMALLNKRNEIFTTMQTVTQVSGNSGVSASFIIKDPSKIDALAKEFYEKGLPEYFDVKVDDSQYKSVLLPVEGLQTITKIFTIAVILTGIVILLILSNISIRERKYEIGVLRAMGMKKRNIAIGMFTEIMVITSTCLVLALSMAAFVSEPIANTVYQKQKAANVEHIANTETIHTIEVALDVDTMIKIILISLVLAGSTSIISIWYVTKFEPLKILSERN